MNSGPIPRTQIRLSKSFIVVLCLSVLALLSFVIKDQLYVVVDTTVQSSALLSALAVFCSEPLLVLLVLSAAGIAAWSWFKDRNIFWTIAASGIGAIAAYLVSTILKLIVTEQRPCQSIHVATALACPPLGTGLGPRTIR